MEGCAGLMPKDNWKTWDDKIATIERDQPQENLTTQNTQKTSDEHHKNEYIKDIVPLLSNTLQELDKYDDKAMVSEMPQTKFKRCMSYLTRALYKLKGSQPDIGYSQEGMLDISVPSFVKIEANSPSFILKITTPLLYPRKYSGGYLTGRMAYSSVRQYERTHEKFIVPNEPLIMVFERNIHTTEQMPCDNDNYEGQRITNAICDALNISDACDVMSFYYTAFISSESSSTVFLMTRNMFSKYASWPKEGEA